MPDATLERPCEPPRTALRLGLPLGLAMAVVATSFALSPPRSPEVERAIPVFAGPDDPKQEVVPATLGFSTEWPWEPSPIAYGELVPLETVQIALELCGCPVLPASGPASPKHVERAWSNFVGDLALEFDNGVVVAFETGWGETPEEWLDGFQEWIDEDLGFGRLIPLRGTTAFAAGIDEGEAGLPSGLNWVEGDALVTAGGKGGQTLTELADFAESLAG